MTDQDQQSTETTVSSEQPKLVADDPQLSSSNNETKVDDTSVVDSKPAARRVMMPQDVRYSTEANDREKLLEKYNNYEESTINACNIRFLIDHREKKLLLGQNEGKLAIDEPECECSLFSRRRTEESRISWCHLRREHLRKCVFLSRVESIVIFFQPGYQQSTKHSYKTFGTEANVRQCLIEVINRIFKQSKKQPSNKGRGHRENSAERPSPCVSADENVEEKSPESQPTLIFVTTINPDSSITEETKPVTPATPNVTEEKGESKSDPIPRAREHKFVMLITSQGQEVLKSNDWPIDVDTLVGSALRKLEFLRWIITTASERRGDQRKWTKHASDGSRTSLLRESSCLEGKKKNSSPIETTDVWSWG